jgi:hypothetical protein
MAALQAKGKATRTSSSCKHASRAAVGEAEIARCGVRLALLLRVGRGGGEGDHEGQRPQDSGERRHRL